MHIFICDDDAAIRDELTGLLQGFFAEHQLAAPQLRTFESGEALLAAQEPADILFLDIEMPGVNGIETGRRIKEQNPDCIIFVVTSFPDYLDDALRFHAFRFLSKPILPARLFRNMDDALSLYRSLRSELVIETSEGTFRVRAREIRMIESAGRGTFVHLEQEDPLFCRLSMEEWEERLPTDAFFRTSRAYIVNLAHVRQIAEDVVYLRNTDARAELSRRRKAECKKALLLYKESAQ